MSSIKKAEPANETVFPWSLIEEIFDLILERKIEVIRFCDLDYQHSWCSSRYRYFDEYVRFHGGHFLNPFSVLRCLVLFAFLRGGNRWLKKSRTYKTIRDMLFRGSRPPVLILEHDADSWPDKTIEMMRREQARSLKSSNYFFVEHAAGERYDLDVKELQKLEEWGHEIGYHQNAYERSNFNIELAREYVDSDVQWLQQHFKILSFVPHGGRRSLSGIVNSHFPHQGKLSPLLWAYNGNCVLKEFTWSDGGIKKRKIPPIDPREFIKNLVNGSRAMILAHPQYYGDTLREDWKSLSIAKEEWWRKLWGL